MKRFKCAECGQGQVIPVAKPGRHAAFKNIPDLEVPDTLEIPTCENCGAEWLDDDSTRRLDAALAEAYRRELSKKANAALRKLKAAKLRQWDLEPALGLSSGYLSKIKTGKDISPALTAALMLLAEAPARLEELRNLWRCTPPTEPKIAAQSQIHYDLSKSTRWRSDKLAEAFLTRTTTTEIRATRLSLSLEHQPRHNQVSEFLPGLEAAA